MTTGRVREGRGNVVTVREMRHDFADVVNRVRYGGQRFVVTRHGAPRVAVVPLEDLELLRRVKPDVG